MGGLSEKKMQKKKRRKGSGCTLQGSWGWGKDESKESRNRSATQALPRFGQDLKGDGRPESVVARTMLYGAMHEQVVHKKRQKGGGGEKKKVLGGTNRIQGEVVIVIVGKRSVDQLCQLLTKRQRNSGPLRVQRRKARRGEQKEIKRILSGIQKSIKHAPGREYKETQHNNGGKRKRGVPGTV